MNLQTLLQSLTAVRIRTEKKTLLPKYFTHKKIACVHGISFYIFPQKMIISKCKAHYICVCVEIDYNHEKEIQIVKNILCNDFLFIQ